MTNAPRTYGDMDLYRRLWRQAHPYRWGLLGLVGLSLLAAPLALLMPVPVKVVVDHVLGTEPLPSWLDAVLPVAWRDASTLLVVAAVAMVVIAALTQLQSLARWLLQTWIGQKLAFEFRSRLFDHVQRLSLGYHHRKGATDAVYRLQFDAPSIDAVAIEGAIPFLTSIVKVLVLLYATFRIDPWLAGIAVLGGPLLFGLTELFRRKLRTRWSALREIESEAMQVASEALGAVRVVKAFGQENRERDRYAGRVHAGVAAAMSAVKAHGLFDLVVGLATGAGAAFLLYLGARHVQDGAITLGELLLAMAYLSQLFEPLRDVGTRLANMQKALASAERVFSLLDEAQGAPERAGALPRGRAEGTFTFRDVTFGYNPSDPILEHVSLEIPAGARVGIAGRTGSGKSTLLALLPRFYDPQEGEILLDGVDLRDWQLADLRRNFAFVLQESVLFSTTIRENIAYGRASATDAEIEEAARAAAAHAFIVALPEGYETQVGERGSRLSGGERQRVALARAFLCDAPVLLLDEPTSSLDSGTEAEVMDAVERLMEGRTTFTIAHRLETLEASTIRLQVGDGRVEVKDDPTTIALE